MLAVEFGVVYPVYAIYYSYVLCLHRVHCTIPVFLTLYYSDYVLERQIALQSDDIIKPTASTDPPKKSYAEIMSGSPTIAKYASAAGVADKPAAPKSGPVSLLVYMISV